MYITKPSRVASSTHVDRLGFALVSTITILILLVTIAMGVITLSSNTSRVASGEKYEAEAKANARLAVTIALAQLQKYTGPDQRVTATASVFDSDPETLPIEGVNHPSTVGVWSTVTEDGDPIIYQEQAGYHSDRRNPSDPGHIDHKEQVLTWLVSGSKKGNFDPRVSELSEGTDAIALGLDNGDPVLAPLVSTKSNGKKTGSYAYHVTDLGMASPIIQYNKNVSAQPSIESVSDGGYANLYTGQKRQYAKLSETQPLSNLADDELVQDSEQTNRYVSYGTGALDPDGSANQLARDFLKTHSQEITSHNSALIINTLTGEFKKDLTPFIQNTSSAGLGELDGQNQTLLIDETPMLEHDRFKRLSPKFGILRDYIKLGNMAGKNRTINPQIAKYGGGALQDYPDPTKVIKAGVHPYIVEYSFYARPVINSAAPKNISLLIYPRVTLWNPYNVTIRTSGYFVQINQRATLQIDINQDANKDGKYDIYNWNSSYWGNILGNDGTKARTAYMFFFLDPVEIQPGQSLVFTPKNTTPQKLEYRDGAIQYNILSAESDPMDLNCFYVDMTGGPAINTSKNIQYRFRRFWENGYHIGYGESTSARLRLSNGPASYDQVISGSTDSPNYPIVHTMDIHNWVRGNEGRWHDINRPWLPVLKMSSANSVPPDNRTKIGMRLKSFRETAENMANLPNAFWNYPIWELSNMRSPFYRRTPWDWIFWIPTVKHEYSFGPLASENQEQPGYLDPFMLPRYTSEGVAETSPFMNSSSLGELRYTIFDIPPAEVDVYSIGQLRQAPLTHEFSAPSFIIGESMVPVTSPREHTAFPKNQYKSMWWNGLHQSRVTGNATWWENSYDPETNYAAYDYRYEINHALWDDFFFSTKPQNTSLSSYTEKGSLPNPNIYVVNDSGANLNDNQEKAADTIAKNLRLHNHHSVNSTNVIAWKALLSMNMGMDIDGKNTADNAAPFPGISAPAGNGTTPGGSMDSETWTGYRQLNEQELNRLAEQIVVQVKRRAPFISLSDFVNRRLRQAEIDPNAAPTLAEQSEEDLLSYAGPIEIAIQKAALNASLRDIPIKSGQEYTKASLVAGGAEGFATANLPNECYANSPAHLTQGKILETIGALLTPRSDTFRIRAYGESRDSKGRVMATAWCEVVVQRTSEYIDSSADNATVKFDDLNSELNKDFGRKYKIESFRWLNPDEVSMN